MEIFKYKKAIILSAVLLGLVMGLSMSHVQAKSGGVTATTNAPAVSAAAIPNKEIKLYSAALAVVGDEVITSRKVKLNYLIRMSLVGYEAAKKNETPNADFSGLTLSESSENFEKELKEVMLESVVQLEATSFSVGVVEKSEIKEVLIYLTKALKNNKSYQEIHPSELELETTLIRQLQAKEFLKIKTENSEVKITDDDALKYYEKHKVKFGSVPFDQFKENIKLVLGREKMEESLKDWFEILKRKYKVRIISKNQ